MTSTFAEMSPQEFSVKAAALLAQAERQCRDCPDSDLDHWLALAKHRGMTWVEGLEWINQTQGSR